MFILGNICLFTIMGGRGTPSQVRGGSPFQVWLEGYPIPGLAGGSGWGTPFPPPWTWDEVPLLDLGWDTPWTWDGVPPRPGIGYPLDLGQGTPLDLVWGTPQTWDWVPPGPGTGYPPGSGMGYPPRPGMGYPPRPGMGYPPGPGMGTPTPWAWDGYPRTWDGVPHPPGPGTGYPLPLDLGRGTPPPQA